MSTARALTDLEKRWSLRALLHCEVASPAICELAVERTLLIPTRAKVLRPHTPRTLIAHIALAGAAAGITLGRKVFVVDHLFDERGEIPLQLAVHEVAHVAQYLRDGHAGFLTRYLVDYARGRRRGLSDRDAYLAIPHEVEARAVDSFIAAHSQDPELRELARVFY